MSERICFVEKNRSKRGFVDGSLALEIPGSDPQSDDGRFLCDLSDAHPDFVAELVARFNAGATK